MRLFNKRLRDAEAERDAALESLQIALDAMRQRTELVSIQRDKRKVRLLFSRNNELTQVEAYITLDHDWDTIERRLMGDG